MHQSRRHATALLASLALVCALALAPPVQGSNCPRPCAETICTEPADCAHGVVKDNCLCCHICGTGLGGQCGVHQTQCGPALWCRIEPSNPWSGVCVARTAD